MLLRIEQLVSGWIRLNVRQASPMNSPSSATAGSSVAEVQVGPLWPSTILHGPASPWRVIHPNLFMANPSLTVMTQPQSWGPFVIVQADPLESIQEERCHSFPPRRDSRQARSSQPRRRALNKSTLQMESERCDHQDSHPEIDDEIIDLYAHGWKQNPTPPSRPDSLETHKSDPTPLISSWDDSSDSDSDTVTPGKTKWRKAVTATKSRLKQMKSKENLLDLPGLRKKDSQSKLNRSSTQATVPLVRITSVGKLERHYGYTSRELQNIGVDSSCRVNGKSWSSGRWG